jgi:hypothetical protein
MKCVKMSCIRSVSVLNYLILVLEKSLSLSMEGIRLIHSVMLCYKIRVHRSRPAALEEIPG